MSSPEAKWYIIRVETSINNRVDYYFRSHKDVKSVASDFMEAESRNKCPACPHFIEAVEIEAVEVSDLPDRGLTSPDFEDDYHVRCLFRMPTYEEECEQSRPTASVAETAKAFRDIAKTTEPGVLDVQHGGDHYKGVPKGYQPIEIAEILNLSATEFSVLKYLLRHKRKNGAEDVKKMLHFGQMLLKMNYGVESSLTTKKEQKDG